jgi:hypothetical protein
MNAKRTLFGPLSIGLPMLALGAEAMLGSARAPGDAVRNSLETSVLAGAFGCFVLGLVFGIVGCRRVERLRWLPAIGVGFNLVVIAIHCGT